jgi:hypothetical protein
MCGVRRREGGVGFRFRITDVSNSAVQRREETREGGRRKDEMMEKG